MEYMHQPISRSKIKKLYLKDGLSVRKIAIRLGKGEATVLRYLRLYEIERRPQHQWLGKKHGDVAIEKMRAANIGRKATPEQRKRMSEQRTGRSRKGFLKRIRQTQGYILLWMPNHPMANKTGYVMEHRLLKSIQLNRILLEGDVVHHLNGKKDDNRLENLEVMSKSAHASHHAKNRKGVKRC